MLTHRDSYPRFGDTNSESASACVCRNCGAHDARFVCGACHKTRFCSQNCYYHSMKNGDHGFECLASRVFSEGPLTKKRMNKATKKLLKRVGQGIDVPGWGVSDPDFYTPSLAENILNGASALTSPSQDAERLEFSLRSVTTAVTNSTAIIGQLTENVASVVKMLGSLTGLAATKMKEGFDVISTIYGYVSSVAVASYQWASSHLAAANSFIKEVILSNPTLTVASLTTLLFIVYFLRSSAAGRKKSKEMLKREAMEVGERAKSIMNAKIEHSNSKIAKLGASFLRKVAPAATVVITQLFTETLVGLAFRIFLYGIFGFNMWFVVPMECIALFTTLVGSVVARYTKASEAVPVCERFSSITFDEYVEKEVIGKYKRTKVAAYARNSMDMMKVFPELTKKTQALYPHGTPQRNEIDTMKNNWDIQNEVLGMELSYAAMGIGSRFSKMNSAAATVMYALSTYAVNKEIRKSERSPIAAMETLTNNNADLRNMMISFIQLTEKYSKKMIQLIEEFQVDSPPSSSSSEPTEMEVDDSGEMQHDSSDDGPRAEEEEGDTKIEIMPVEGTIQMRKSNAEQGSSSEQRGKKRKGGQYDWPMWALPGQQIISAVARIQISASTLFIAAQATLAFVAITLVYLLVNQLSTLGYRTVTNVAEALSDEFFMNRLQNAFIKAIRKAKKFVDKTAVAITMSVLKRYGRPFLTAIQTYATKYSTASNSDSDIDFQINGKIEEVRLKSVTDVMNTVLGFNTTTKDKQDFVPSESDLSTAEKEKHNVQMDLLQRAGLWNASKTEAKDVRKSVEQLTAVFMRQVIDETPLSNQDGVALEDPGTLLKDVTTYDLFEKALCKNVTESDSMDHFGDLLKFVVDDIRAQRQIWKKEGRTDNDIASRFAGKIGMSETFSKDPQMQITNVAKLFLWGLSFSEQWKLSNDVDKNGEALVRGFWKSLEPLMDQNALPSIFSPYHDKSTSQNAQAIHKNFRSEAEGIPVAWMIEKTGDKQDAALARKFKELPMSQKSKGLITMEETEKEAQSESFFSRSVETINVYLYRTSPKTFRLAVLNGPISDWIRARAVDVSYTAEAFRNVVSTIQEGQVPEPPYRTPLTSIVRRYVNMFSFSGLAMHIFDSQTHRLAEALPALAKPLPGEPTLTESIAELAAPILYLLLTIWATIAVFLVHRGKWGEDKINDESETTDDPQSYYEKDAQNMRNYLFRGSGLLAHSFAILVYGILAATQIFLIFGTLLILLLDLLVAWGPLGGFLSSATVFILGFMGYRLLHLSLRPFFGFFAVESLPRPRVFAEVGAPQGPAYDAYYDSIRELNMGRKTAKTVARKFTEAYNKILETRKVYEFVGAHSADIDKYVQYGLNGDYEKAESTLGDSFGVRNPIAITAARNALIATQWSIVALNALQSGKTEEEILP